MSTVWKNLHENYKGKDWIDKPSLFALSVTQYIQPNSKILELGAGQAQDSRYFAELDHTVTSTDISEEAQDLARNKVTESLKDRVLFQVVDLRERFPYKDESYDAVYAHLSIHYFDWEATKLLIDEIKRVLEPGGLFTFLANSTSDPECGTGIMIEENYFKIGDAKKRFFDISAAEELTKGFETILVDNLGETHKDSKKGVHNLIRYVGRKTA